LSYRNHIFRSEGERILSIATKNEKNGSVCGILAIDTFTVRDAGCLALASVLFPMRRSVLIEPNPKKKEVTSPISGLLGLKLKAGACVFVLK
jgi:hypothetical protein